MPDPIATLEPVDLIAGQAVESFGLRRHILSPLEVLAQSVSTIAPSTTPPLNIALVFAMAIHTPRDVACSFASQRFHASESANARGS